MNVNDIKANYLKANKRNYYLFNGYHISKISNYYLLTWLYNDIKFNTLKDLKKYIKNN